MQTFDCLALDCPLFGPHLLEASAGTGKTFSIEHIYVRFILEAMEVEQILAVTFTKAATRELKGRIRNNLEKAIRFIKTSQTPWDYLKPHLGSQSAVRLLTDALATFDRHQIFTIHGFCYRMLKEFAFEANVGSLSNPDEENSIPERLRRAVSDFLRLGIDDGLLAPEQVALLFKEFDSVEEVADRLLRMEDDRLSYSFSECYDKCKAALQQWRGPPLAEEMLLEDFHALEKNYKSGVRGDFEIQVRGLVNGSLFPKLLKERGTIFDFLAPENRKVRAKEPTSLHYPGFFDWARDRMGPWINQKVFPILQKAWNPIGEKVLDEEEYFDPDELIARMKKAIDQEPLAERIRSKYKAAIIDEFQDTDTLQWEIFQKLFLHPSLRAFYLVGDPKQSIYRFRKADVYTYIKARNVLGEEALYRLGTNFRSSKSLIGALNALFAREWLDLPKMGVQLPYYPVQAGANIESDFLDQKGAIHFFMAEGEPGPLFDEAFLPYVVEEIERLELKGCALLVKDRFQAQKAVDLLQKRGLSAVARSHIPIGQTEAFRAVEELFSAVLSPHDSNAAAILMAGPFGQPDLSLGELKNILEEKGLVPFAKKFPLNADATQIFEHLFAWEQGEGFSVQGLKRCLTRLKTLEADEGGRHRTEVDAEAVQIMTLHISKGLEFDVVFALGLVSRTPASEEADEADAEKKRQLYVAMTRAKKRLYVPIALSKKEAEKGTHAPIELFARHFEGAFTEQLLALAERESITLESISSPISLIPPVVAKKQQAPSAPALIPHPFTPLFLASFTTLAKPQKVEWTQMESDPCQFTMQTMPRGSDTGIVIHKIFETLFRGSRGAAEIHTAVEGHVRSSSLAPWKGAIEQMVQETISLPLQGDGEWFTLAEIDRFQVEMEFLFTDEQFVKGFIDLVFYRRNKVYFLDWKTNWLEEYGQAALQKAMEAHDYGLQASLYAEAIRRHFKRDFGRAYYVFVRGGAVYSPCVF